MQPSRERHRNIYYQTWCINPQAASARDTVAAALLGGIQREVGALEDRLWRILGMFQRADADAGRHADGLAAWES